jgi:hypothetical protein
VALVVEQRGTRQTTLVEELAPLIKVSQVEWVVARLSVVQPVVVELVLLEVKVLAQEAPPVNVVELVVLVLLLR